MNEYIKYHVKSSEARDIDPANDTLRYICDRFELNIEQRYWIAFLYACTYSPTSTYYAYNEFPDFETVDTDRLLRWWKRRKPVLIFQTDRLRVKSSDLFVPAFESYRHLIGSYTQAEAFSKCLVCGNPDESYERVYKFASNIHTFGRFTLFIYLEMIHVLTGLPIQPTRLDLSTADSCRNGVALAIGRDDLSTHGTDRKLSPPDLVLLEREFERIHDTIKTLPIEHTNIWNVETTLCAYKKYKLGKRWVGYYIERARKEIETLEKAVPSGVDWSPLWDFRRETYNPQYLRELWSK